ncbi:putative YY1-associated factor 2 [Apostichopus japonicus]|uniref:Putative YY1-associated factor 2 n=1 Tax=Stichopus japonicus TaxID=307972 RepID=A0A2G8L7N0_STIJA|nr:putative YY1-associated factor 2 [Apostichopus japonicus]
MPRMSRSPKDTRRKRSTRSPEAGYWDCSVCTYRNNAEAFKCEICDVRKGTSTRKPRLNAQVVEQQKAQQMLAPQILPPKQSPNQSKLSIKTPGLKKSGNRKNRPRLKNVDRSSAVTTEVVVNNVRVVITEYMEKPPKAPVEPSSTLPKSTLNNNVDE